MPGNEQDLSSFNETCGTGNFRVEATAFLCGTDAVVIIGGGTRYHVGAVAMAEPRSSLQDSSEISASASVLCVIGHKEDELARSLALYMATNLNKRIVVTAGIHINKASAKDLEILIQNCWQAVERITQRILST